MFYKKWPFLFFAMFASCTNTAVQKFPNLDGFSKQDISNHWTLQLPTGSKIRRWDSVYFGSGKVTFPNDSLSISYYYQQEDVDLKTDCLFSARAKMMESGGCQGICQGDGSNPIKYVPVVNPKTQITGCRGDWKSNNRRFVVYLVYDCRSGEFLTLKFEGVGNSNHPFVGNIIESLEFRK